MKSLFDLPRQFLLAIAVVLVALTVFSTHQLMYAGTTGAFGAVVLSCAGLLALLIVAGLGHVVATLKPLLEARVGGAVQAYGNQAPAHSNQLSRRHDLEHSLAHSLAPALASRMDGIGVGSYIRQAVDALMGAGEQKAGGPLKAAAPGVAEPAMPGPSVTAEHIAAMMARVEYRFDQPGSTTSTFAHAFLDGSFYLDTGHSACVSPENFNRATGEKYALEQAETKARNKLWAMEGYLLRHRLAA